MIEPGFRPRSYDTKAHTFHHCYTVSHWCVCVLSGVRLSLTPWTVAHQVPLSMGFFRQEYWRWLPFSTPEDLLNPWIKPTSHMSPVLAGRFFTTSPPGKLRWYLCTHSISYCLFMQCFFSLTLYSFLQSRPSWYIHMFS